MSKITQNEAIKYIRKCARSVGLVFKRTNKQHNGKALWSLVDRESGSLLVDNYQLWTAYEDALSGWIKRQGE